ncbi:hypothetical protein [Cumulibacter manganitolerans]|uniref:hypothetical protein n=1 Tax=Cumulibacter manganitolerans TaxID=1884992 RepID=UPI001295B724|nr:hypothetical protein [Cumulibacter manganitolerans]
MATKKHWRDLPPAVRASLIVVGVADASLRAWALVDLKRRPAGKVRGSKRIWAIALSTVNSAGILPATYLGWARKR